MDIKSILITGLIGGAGAWVFSTVIGSIQKRAVNNLPHANKQHANEVEQIRIIDYECTYSDIFPETINALNTIKRSKVKKANKQSMLILVKTDINWKTFGDKIEITFKEKNKNHISLTISSKPRVWGTTVDYGKNFDNVEKIMAYLDARYKQI